MAGDLAIVWVAALKMAPLWDEARSVVEALEALCPELRATAAS